MSDTEDVAKVLFEYIMAYPYRKGWEYHYKPEGTETLLRRLEILANHYHIGIEDARKLLRTEAD